MKHKNMGNVTRTCHHCNGWGFIMTDTHSYPCECDAINADIDVYDDKDAPYRVIWALLDLEGEVVSAFFLSDDASNDMECSTAIGLRWLRSKEYKSQEKLHRQGFVIVTDRHGNHVRVIACKKAKVK